MPEKQIDGEKLNAYREYRIYKPNKQGNGAASKLQLRVRYNPYRDVMVFWEMTTQAGVDENNNAKFNWATERITIKLGENDLGEILAFCEGKKPEINLFHKAPGANGNSVLKMTKGKNPGLSYIAMSSQKDGKLTKINHSLTDGELIIIRELLLEAVRKTFLWTG